MALLLAGLTAFGMTAVPAFAEEQTGTAAEAAMQSVLPNGKEVYNVLLIGSDRRNDSWNGNSDVMIVMSVNAASKELSLTSFMRDLYADIPGIWRSQAELCICRRRGKDADGDVRG